MEKWFGSNGYRNSKDYCRETLQAPNLRVVSISARSKELEDWMSNVLPRISADATS